MESFKSRAMHQFLNTFPKSSHKSSVLLVPPNILQRGHMVPQRVYYSSLHWVINPTCSTTSVCSQRPLAGRHWCVHLFYCFWLFQRVPWDARITFYLTISLLMDTCVVLNSLLPEIIPQQSAWSTPLTRAELFLCNVYTEMGLWSDK